MYVKMTIVILFSDVAECVADDGTCLTSDLDPVGT